MALHTEYTQWCMVVLLTPNVSATTLYSAQVANYTATSLYLAKELSF